MLGYGKELDYLNDLEGATPRPPIVLFDEHPHVKQPKPLTERSESWIR